MKEDLCEYYPNGQKRSEQFYDQLGKFHQESGIPDYQSCYVTGITDLITFYAHGCRHNIYNPCYIDFFDNGKICYKEYRVKDINYNKLDWMNLIKNI